jgi:hypothetical protein
LRPSIAGIVGAVICIIGLALPWWTLSRTLDKVPASIDFFLYRTTITGTGLTQSGQAMYWVGLIAITFLITGIIVALVGSITFDRRPMLLAIGGLLVLTSAIFFPLALPMTGHNDISDQIDSASIFKITWTSPFGNWTSSDHPFLRSGSIESNGHSYNYYFGPTIGLFLAAAGSGLLFLVALKGSSIDEKIKRIEEKERASMNQAAEQQSN